jgi:hypothetical protein
VTVSAWTARRLTGLVVAVAVLLLPACSMLPDDGPVVAGERAAEPPNSRTFDYNPPGPRPGAEPDEIVSGFLSAQQAVPVSTRVAQEYLTEEAASSWRPERRTIVYTSQRVVAEGTGVTVRLEGTSALDASGRWRGEWSQDGRGALRIRVEREGEEWRIVDPPPALTIPRSHFESRYEPFSLYFFDPTGSVLVPEPVYLPVGVQAATRLMAGLLQGPPRGSRDVERSYLPPGTDLGVGVPVRAGGIAEVPLTQQMTDLRPGDLSRALAQIAFTLRQLPEVAGIRVLVDGAPLSMPGEDDEVLPAGAGQEYAPTLDWASPDVFGLRGRQILRVSGSAESTVAVLPPRSVADGGPPRSLGVSIAADRAAVVSGDGTQVWVVTAREGARVGPRRVWSGTDVLRPMWDRTDRLWLVDRTTSGSTITVVSDDGTRRIGAGGLEGARIEAAALSRDGTRLVVVAQRPGELARVLLYRVVRDSLGRPVRLTRPRTLTTTSPLRRTRGIGWWSPTAVAVLTRPSAFSSRVQLLPTDQSSVAVSASGRLDLLFEAGQAMAVSPGGPKTLLVAAAQGETHELGADGRWAEVDLPDLRAPTFVG